jgi:hypothetical protein
VLRLVERVRIIFSVLFASSDETMSPATSDEMTGAPKNVAKARSASGSTTAVSVTCVASGMSGGMPACFFSDSVSTNASA